MRDERPTQSVGVDVPTGHVVQEVLHLLRQGLVVPLHEEDPLVPERTGPVCVNLELTSNILRDDQQLWVPCIEIFT